MSVNIALCVFLKINLFTYLFIFGCIGSFVAADGLSLIAASGGYSSLWCAGFSLQWLLCCRAQALGERASVLVTCRLSSCGSWALEWSLSSCGAWA